MTMKDGIALAVAASVTAGAGAGLEPGKARTLVIGYGGLQRTCTVRLPAGSSKPQTPSPDEDGRRPVVFVLHGGGGTSASVARLTRFDAIADSAGFILAWPNAVNGHWNDGRGVRKFRSQRHGIDDVGFVRTLIDWLVADHGADPHRVYATGISNGAMMCHRLGCELGDRIAAIAPVAGGLPAPLADEPRPGEPVSVLAINGTRDPVVRYEGGAVGLVNKRGETLGAAATVRFWAEADSCTAHAGPQVWRDADPHDRMRVLREEWTGGRDGSEVRLYTVEGGGHTWPGGADRPGRFGRISRDFDATREIWSFFQEHRR